MKVRCIWETKDSRAWGQMTDTFSTHKGITSSMSGMGIEQGKVGNMYVFHRHV